MDLAYGSYQCIHWTSLAIQFKSSIGEEPWNMETEGVEII